jgi:tRNA A-37 threonylcarbamoyl transferase component Bud32
VKRPRIFGRGKSPPARRIDPPDELAQLATLVEQSPLVPPDAADPLALLDAATAKGQAEPALLLARRLVARRVDDTAFRLAVAERLHARADSAAVRALAEPLFAHPTHGLRARFLCAEAAEQEGDLALARAFYEQILAVDLDYPNARVRAQRLAGEAVPIRSASLAPTILAVDSSGTRASRYRLLRELGRGGAATVYLARDEEIGREVALKILHPQFYGPAHAAARARFFAEARIAAQVRHPCIVAVYDVDEPLRLIAMEHCAGRSLRDRLQRGPLLPEAALHRLRQLLSALTFVHRHGVVHHDLKPGNLLFRDHAEDAPLVIADFGAAHLASTGVAGTRGGTLLYMSPEQRRGAPPSPADDLWAAGAIFVEMTTGAPPYSVEQLLRATLPPPPTTFAFARRLLDPDPTARFANAAAAATSIEQMLAQLPQKK